MPTCHRSSSCIKMPTSLGCFRASQRPATAVRMAGIRQQAPVRHTLACHSHSSWRAGIAAGVASAALLLASSGAPAWAAGRKPPPITESADRCTVAALDSFADTRARFSQEASGGNMTEAFVDVRGCDFSNLDLSEKVFSGVLMQNANLTNSRVTGTQFARADARDAILTNVDFTDTNCYGSQFDGADLRGAQFENSILTGATFGKGSQGEWANLAGAHFEGALISSSDVVRICENPTLEQDTKKYELGCRLSR